MRDAVRAVVLSDTHLRGDGRRRLPDAVYRALESCDAVLHAGDLVVTDVVWELARYAPTYAVLGNNDEPALAAMVPLSRVEVLGGVRVAVVHDSGPTAARPARMRRRFPDADVVVYGHSHVPFDGEGLDGQRLFNPGSPTERRSQPRPTFGVLDLAAGRVVRSEIVAIEDEPARPAAGRAPATPATPPGGAS